MELIFTSCIIVALLSIIIFIVGLSMKFSSNEKKKKIGLQLILYSTIAFVIGFGTCYATIFTN